MNSIESSQGDRRIAVKWLKPLDSPPTNKTLAIILNFKIKTSINLPINLTNNSKIIIKIQSRFLIINLINTALKT